MLEPCAKCLRAFVGSCRLSNFYIFRWLVTLVNKVEIGKMASSFDHCHQLVGSELKQVRERLWFPAGPSIRMLYVFRPSRSGCLSIFLGNKTLQEISLIAPLCPWRRICVFLSSRTKVRKSGWFGFSLLNSLQPVVPVIVTVVYHHIQSFWIYWAG